jgi:CRP/FNR family transcriptional regulator, cyclic AMP receptor protein
MGQPQLSISINLLIKWRSYRVRRKLMTDVMILQPANTVRILQRHSDQPKAFAAGEVIFREGEPGDYIYGILEGEVEMVVAGEAVETIQAGDVFGEGAFVQIQGVRRSTAVAKTDCRLAYLDEKRFLFAIQETPEFALQLLRSYSDRLYHFKHGRRP